MVMACVVMASIVMAYIVMASAVMAYIVMAYIVMAYIVRSAGPAAYTIYQQANVAVPSGTRPRPCEPSRPDLSVLARNILEHFYR